MDNFEWKSVFASSNFHIHRVRFGNRFRFAFFVVRSIFLRSEKRSGVSVSRKVRFNGPFERSRELLSGNENKNEVCYSVCLLGIFF